MTKFVKLYLLIVFITLSGSITIESHSLNKSLGAFDTIAKASEYSALTPEASVMLKDGRAWISLYEDYFEQFGSQNYHFFNMEDKLEIDGKIYTRLIDYNMLVSNTHHLWVREENGKVYYRNEALNKDVLYFDFALKCGNKDSFGFEVVASDVIKDQHGISRDRYFIDYPGFYPYIVINGIGASLVPLTEGKLNAFESIIPAYFENDEIILTRDDFYTGSQWEVPATYDTFVKPDKTWWYRLSGLTPGEKNSQISTYVGFKITDYPSSAVDGWYPLILIKESGEEFTTPVGYFSEGNGKVFYRDNSVEFLSIEFNEKATDDKTKAIYDNIRLLTLFQPGNETAESGELPLYDFSSKPGTYTTIAGIRNALYFDREVVRHGNNGQINGRRIYCPQPDDFTVFVSPIHIVFDGIGLVLNPNGSVSRNQWLYQGFFFNPFPFIRPDQIMGKDYPDMPEFITLTDSGRIMWREESIPEGPWQSAIKSISLGHEPEIQILDKYITVSGCSGECEFKIYDLSGIPLMSGNLAEGASASLANLPAGYYIISVNDEYGHISTKKQIIK